jgi:hypothetical protein
VHIGRFRVLEPIEARSVVEAHDPELDRTVAITLIRVPEPDRAAVLDAARAVARVSHPSLEAVHAVGAWADGVYLARDPVRGEALRVWSRGKPLGAVTRAFAQVGDALAAAHQAGVAHGAFTGDSAVIGGDGRARIVDLEPRRGATAGGDQLAFTAALSEAVPAAPGWLAAALTARHASMPALVKAITRDPARTRMRRAVWYGVLAAVAVFAYVTGRNPAPKPPALCGSGDQQLEAVWAPAGRAAALGALAAMGADGRALAERLDAYEERWARGRLDACTGHRAGTVSDAQLAQRIACLDRGRASLADIAARLPATTLADIAPRVDALPDLAICD